MRAARSRPCCEPDSTSTSSGVQPTPRAAIICASVARSAVSPSVGLCSRAAGPVSSSTSVMRARSSAKGSSSGAGMPKDSGIASARSVSRSRSPTSGSWKPETAAPKSCRQGSSCSVVRVGGGRLGERDHRAPPDVRVDQRVGAQLLVGDQHRAAADAERLRETALGWQPEASRELAGK